MLAQEHLNPFLNGLQACIAETGQLNAFFKEAKRFFQALLTALQLRDDGAQFVDGLFVTGLSIAHAVVLEPGRARMCSMRQSKCPSASAISTASWAFLPFTLLTKLP